MGIGFAAIVLIPFIANVYTSLFQWKGGLAPMRWYGLGNYVDLLGDELFWSSFRNTVVVIAALVVVPTAIGLVLAAFLFDYIGRRFGTRSASFLRATFYLPQIVPIAVAGVIWSWVLNAREGAINTFLGAVGVSPGPDWLGDPKLAMYSLSLVLVWGQIGYPVVIFMSALQRIDPELHEAAEVDGANWWHRFRAISVPQIRPEVFIVVLTATVGALKVFAPVLILTNGGPESSTYVPSYYSYLNFFQLSRVGYGSALATVLTVIIFILASVLLWWQRRSVTRLEG
ncbi:ABC transporter permease [Rathayibacter sp. Leaf185]|nr:sugar ABC transporter permease [Rathayibacter sp. Leaf185]KQQ04204.1 ABC transporter permease [Rathayibacter sp. Leaf294]KQS12656.1 ABC transporter permease [Rathayibacter sp. Leaf185]